jgi:hypothetical protein
MLRKAMALWRPPSCVATSSAWLYQRLDMNKVRGTSVWKTRSACGFSWRFPVKGKNKSGVQGAATTRRHKEILESGGEHDNAKVPDSEIQKVPKTRRIEAMKEGERKTNLSGRKGRQSEFAVSRGGMNQESRQHNKP